MDSAIITAYSTLILAIATAISVIFIGIQAYLFRTQSERETKRRQLQVVTQLDGRKTELLDIHMSLIQMKADCEKYKILRYRFLPDSEEEKRVINEEYARQRQFADNRIVDVTKSFGLLVESLSAVQYLFRSVPEIENKVKKIIQNEYLFKTLIENRINQWRLSV